MGKHSSRPTIPPSTHSFDLTNCLPSFSFDPQSGTMNLCLGPTLMINMDAATFDRWCLMIMQHDMRGNTRLIQLFDAVQELRRAKKASSSNPIDLFKAEQCVDTMLAELSDVIEPLRAADPQ